MFLEGARACGAHCVGIFRRASCPQKQKHSNTSREGHVDTLTAAQTLLALRSPVNLYCICDMHLLDPASPYAAIVRLSVTARHISSQARSTNCSMLTPRSSASSTVRCGTGPPSGERLAFSGEAFGLPRSMSPCSNMPECART